MYIYIYIYIGIYMYYIRIHLKISYPRIPRIPESTLAIGNQWI